MGGDFQYESANNNFKNMDKLIKYVNLAVKKETHSSICKSIRILYSKPMVVMSMRSIPHHRAIFTR